jgi:monofunctional biosynthetic peptidoglycan transglycosylase
MQRELALLQAKSPRELRHPLGAIRADLGQLKRAVIASEDARFTEHEGVDWERSESLQGNVRRGGPARGGSTITQQLEEPLLSPERSYLRKAQELMITYMIEACGTSGASSRSI